jgi:hypothetical protein
VALCAGLPGERDELLSELLVHALRVTGVDARSVILENLDNRPEPGKSELVSIVFIVFPLKETYDRWLSVLNELRAGLPQALIVTIRPSLDPEIMDQPTVSAQVDMVLSSFEEGLAFVATNGRTGA